MDTQLKIQQRRGRMPGPVLYSKKSVQSSLCLTRNLKYRLEAAVKRTGHSASDVICFCLDRGVPVDAIKRNDLDGVKK